jgi:hypothetical protein
MSSQTTAQHTPGPWRSRGNQIVIFRKDSDAVVLAEVMHFDGAKWEAGDAVEMGANLRLMLAAPDLLTALLDTRKLVTEAGLTGFNCHDGNWAERLFANQAKISAAIAKAEGRS